MLPNGYNDQLFDGEMLRKALEVALPNVNTRFVCISAYMTKPAIEWMFEYLPDEIEVILVCRLNPGDIVSGGTDLEALKLALGFGATVKFLLPLHAKIYVLDDRELFLGSANMTSSGLKIYGEGNLEVAVHRFAEEGSLTFINKIVSLSQVLTLEMIEKMEAYVQDLSDKSVDISVWPEEIVRESSGVWVPDFFWLNPGVDLGSESSNHDLELLGVTEFNSDREIMRQRVLQTRGIIWLIRLLDSAPDKSMYFGALSAQLHTDLQDDPAPYRSEVKSLLQNILGYCQRYLPDDIEVLRPKHSQLVRLLSSSQVV